MLGWLDASDLVLHTKPRHDQDDIIITASIIVLTSVLTTMILLRPRTPNGAWSLRNSGSGSSTSGRWSNSTTICARQPSRRFWTTRGSSRYSQDPLFLLTNVYRTESFRCQRATPVCMASWSNPALDWVMMAVRGGVLDTPPHHTLPRLDRHRIMAQHPRHYHHRCHHHRITTTVVVVLNLVVIGRSSTTCVRAAVSGGRRRRGPKRKRTSGSRCDTPVS
jgi:hypothetical protein